MSRFRVTVFPILFGGLLWPASGARAQSGGQVILDENAPWRRYYRFNPNRISPALLRSQGQQILGARLHQRLKQTTERWLAGQGQGAAGTDWRDHAVLVGQGARWFNPHQAPAPPDDWAAPGFDDRAWVRLRTPFQGGQAPGITSPVLGQYHEDVDLKLDQAFYRARFLVRDAPTAGPMTLRIAYAGGVRVLLNGREIARRHLPAGELSGDAPGEDYPPAAYHKGGETLSRRTLGPLRIPPDAVKPGPNVLAVEIRASCLHPVVLTNPITPNWGDPMRPWPHARLFDVELRGGLGAVSAARRPAGVQVWAEDMHHRVLSGDFPAPGEAPGALRLVGGRNGSYCGQVVVGSDKTLADVQVRCAELRPAGGGDPVAPPAVQVLPMAGFPCEQWSMKVLGDERGLGGAFPTMQELARLAASWPRGELRMFDQILPAPPGAAASEVAIAAGTCRPFWLRVRVPSGAAPGTYRGSVQVAADGARIGSLPVELTVADVLLPDPRDFRTLAGCEQNPYAVARQYGVKPWSQRHFALLEASFAQLARLGCHWLNIPVLAGTEFGNGTDTLVRWIRGPSGWEFDFSLLDRYLDLASKAGGRPRVIHFIVMHGMKPAAGDAPPQVPVLDKGSHQVRLMAVGDSAGPPAAKAWAAFASALLAHMKQRGQAACTYWGAPWEQEAQPGLKKLLAQAAPSIYWTAGPHEMMSNGTYAKNAQFYHVVADIRYHGGWPNFRDDMGWKSKTLHLLNPRAGGTVYALHTTSYPFAYRVMVDRALAMGRGGFTRVGADDWPGVHYSGMTIPRWLTGIPVLFVLWPGADGANSSARFEALVEGVQETELRIRLEQALDSGSLPGALAPEVRTTLAEHFRQTDVCQGNSIIHSIEQYHWNWLDRSRKLHELAAKAARN